jgi:acyl carrier protein
VQVESQSPAPAEQGAAESTRDVLFGLAPNARARAVATRVRELIGQIVKLAPARIDSNRALGALGVDSLMGQELRARLEADLGISLSATLVWNYPTVADLVPHLAHRLSLALGSAEEAPTTVAAESTATLEAAAVVAAVEQLSDADALAQLIGLR